jgi:uncharacterized membrane protein (UPF0127 family)
MRIYSFILLLSVTVCSNAAGPEFSNSRVMIQDQEFNLQIAISPWQRMHGLMHRSSLPDNAGMLFVYPDAGEHRIWMKNTLIPLTVIWLDDQLRVIDIKLLQPCRQTKCPVFGATAPSRYVLELHQSQLRQFRIGDRLNGLRTALP